MSLLREARLFSTLIDMNVKRLLSYRLDFFVGFIGRTFAVFVTAYFLWQMVFERNGVTAINGFTFPELLLYYLFIPLTARIIQGNEMSLIYNEIYDGSVAKYLVYPASFFSFRYAANFAACLLGVVQTLLVVLLFSFFKPDLIWSGTFLGQFAVGLVCSLLGSLLYFLMVAALELIAFWQDQVWSLTVMQRFLLAFFGGNMIPLPLLPPGLREACLWLPFYYVGGFAAEFMVRPQYALLGRGLLVFALWIGIYVVIVKFLWRRGLRRFSGVGQ